MDPAAASDLARHLLFYADFDCSFDATASGGQGTARVAVDAYAPHLTRDGGGRFGEAAEFGYGELRPSVWTHDVVRYAAAGNFPYAPDRAFGGTVSLWLQVDLHALKQRQLVWLDPIHLLGPKATERGKIWMDLVTRELPGAPLFRFGATLPQSLRRNPADPDEGNVIVVPGLEFAGDEWHHVAGCWEGINGAPGTAAFALYLDGRLAGARSGCTQRLDWDLAAWEIRVGLGFRGRIDELVILDRPLSAAEAAGLHAAREPFGPMAGLAG